MKVKNIKGTSDNDCTCCSSWLKHWKNNSGQPLPKHCSEVNCTNSPEVGAHVMKDDSSDDHWYIIPLCKKHNAKSAEMTIVDTELVPVYKTKKCDY